MSGIEEEQEQTVTIGQIVAYHLEGGLTGPAIVTKVYEDGRINMCLFFDEDDAGDHNPAARYARVPRADVAEEGTWVSWRPL